MKEMVREQGAGRRRLDLPRGGRGGQEVREAWIDTA